MSAGVLRVGEVSLTGLEGLCLTMHQPCLPTLLLHTLSFGLGFSCFPTKQTEAQ